MKDKKFQERYYDEQYKCERVYLIKEMYEKVKKNLILEKIESIMHDSDLSNEDKVNECKKVISEPRKNIGLIDQFERNLCSLESDIKLDNATSMVFYSSDIWGLVAEAEWIRWECMYAMMSNVYLSCEELKKEMGLRGISVNNNVIHADLYRDIRAVADVRG